MVANTTKFVKGVAIAQKTIAGFGKIAAKAGKASGFLGSVAREVGGSFAWAAGGIYKFAQSTEVGLMRAMAVTKGTARGIRDSFANAFGPMTRTAGKFIGGFTRMSMAVGRLGVGAFLSAGKAVASLSRSILHGIGTAATYGAVLGGVVAAGLWHVAQGAIALGEQTDRARIVFGNFTSDVVSQANLMADAFGVARKSFVASASAFGTIFQSIGYTQQDSAALSVHFVKLATDLSSLAHIPVAEALEKIQSGLAGQVRPLREVGVFMSEETVEAYAAAHGIAKLGTELTEAQKVQARAGFITEKLAIAQGNLALTADSAGNTVRSLAGRFENLMDTAGTALVSVIGPAISDLTVGVQALQLAWQDSSLAALSATSGVLAGAQQQAQSMGVVQQSIGWIADAWQRVKIGFFYVQSFITSGLSYIVKSMMGLAYAIDFTVGKLTGLKSNLGDTLKAIGDDLGKLSGDQWAKFQQELAAPPPSSGINEYFDKAKQKIADARKELAKPGIDVTKLAPAPTTPAKAAAAPKFASAMEAGSKEATNLILQSRYGREAGKAGPAEETAKNTRQTNNLMQQAVDSLKQMAQGGATDLGSAFGAFLGGSF